ncbi:Niemann-Pick C1 protein [Porphyridium purpureum]|uniref:Niemann-Pick C1 protein n=1 Tax=Porphyridium purpureum TaxID=35688 RepID=A0A5J4YLK2_PORPP|nr:Niemann-Pick C1 protein [Porphyridium purpureum]|eukprot:POR5108..scf295_9
METAVAAEDADEERLERVELGETEKGASGQLAEQAQPAKKKNVLRRLALAIERGMNSFYYRLGWTVAGRPLLTILIMALFGGLVMAGIARYTTESREDYLWVPQGTQALDDKEFVDTYFTSQVRLFDTITYSPDNSINMATKSGILALIDLVQVSYDTETTYIAEDGANQSVSLCSACFYSSNSQGIQFCTQFSVLNLFYNEAFLVPVAGSSDEYDFLATVRAFVETLSDSEIKEKLTVGPYVTWNGANMNKANVVAQVTGAGDSLFIGAFRVTQLLEQQEFTRDGEVMDPRAKAFETEWDDNMVAYETDAFSFVWQSAQTQSDSLSEALFGDISLFTIGFVLLIIYTLIFLGMWHVVYSRVVAGLMLFISIGFALGATFGFSSLCGIFFGPVHQVLPLLVLGIGADDGFVIVRALDQANERHPEAPARQRVATALADAGTAVTVTSLTNACVFFISAITKLPALRTFALWAGIAVVFDFIFTTTMFVAYLTIDERRRDAKRMDILCCKTVETPKETNVFGKYPGVMERFFESKWGPLVTHKWMRLLFIALLTALFGVSVWGTTQLKLDFDFSYFYPDGSRQRLYYDVEQETFGDLGAVVRIYTGAIEYGTAANQNALLELCTPVTGLVAQNEYIQQDTVQCWYHSMRQFYNLPDGQVFPENTFFSQLQDFLASDGARFTSDFNLTSTQILASRFSAEYVPLSNNEDQVNSMQSLRDTVDNSDLPDSFPFFFGFIFYEQYAVIREEALLAVGLSLAMVLVVTLFLVGSPFTALIVLFSLGFSVVDVMGLTYFWGVGISSVSVICLALAVGLSVDFTVHIAKAFMDAPDTHDRRGRVILALKNLGPPVFHAGASTFLAVIVIAGAKSFIFQVFFKMFFLIIVLGMTHGFVLVPALLSILGPASFWDNEEQLEEHENQLRDKFRTSDEDEVGKVLSQSSKDSSRAGSASELRDEQETQV